MSLSLKATCFAIPDRGPGLSRSYAFFCQLALLWILCATPVSAAPVILNEPLTVMPGNVVGVTGSGFGSAPRVYFGAMHSPTPIQVKLVKGDDNYVAFEVPQNQPFDVYKIAISDGTSWSPIVYVNNPRAMHFDMPEIASNDTFRIFGRNLYVPPGSPTVSLLDVSSGEKLVAAVNLSKSDAYSMTLTAPSGIVAGHNYLAVVSNGFGSVNSDICILGHAATGIDHFNLGVPWGRDYIYQNGPKYNGTTDNADHHVYNVTNDRFLTSHAKGDGITDDQPAIQAAINQAAWHGGGVVYLPPGTYRLASSSGSALNMASNVVLQGHSVYDTTILFGPATQQPTSYSFWGFYWQPGATMSGLADLSIKNIDTRSQMVRTVVSGGPTSKLFIQRVNWDLGTGLFLSFNSADRLVVANSRFLHQINRQQPDPVSPDKSGVGPLWFEKLTNFTFRNNRIWWASGGNDFLTINGGIFEGNYFTRAANDKITVTAENISWLNGNPTDQPIYIGQHVQRQLGRQIAVEFAKNLVIQNNRFDVSNGNLMHNNNDGETINSEGGASANEQQDVGTVTAASTTSVTDDSKCAGTCKWNYMPSSAFNPGSMIAIVSGHGWGQWRQIVSRNNNTFTVSPAWDITPAAGDHFAIFVPSMQNTLIRNNMMKYNPRGILLYAAGFYNVSILNNSLTNNGGIYLYGIQDTQRKSFPSPKVGSLRNIEVNGNTVANASGQYPAFIFVAAALRDPNFIWGTGLDGIEVRNNSITGRPGTPRYDSPDGVYTNIVAYTDPDAPYSPNASAYGVVGTIFQGNNCTNCSAAYTVSTGTLDTVIWNPSGNNTVTNQRIWNTATQAAAGLVIGHD